MGQSIPVTFGSPEFWGEVYAAFAPQLQAIKAIEPLAADMFEAGDSQASQPVQIVVKLLVRIVADSLNDVLILAGNGSGLGAMKIARGMFEAAVIAEYLKHNPKEVEDYREYGYIARWNRYQKLLKSAPQHAAAISAEVARDITENYNRVVSRFTRNGQVRNRWHRKSIQQMAKEIGRGEQYDTPYGLAASVHHSSFEGMATHLDGNDQGVQFVDRPSLAWVAQALISAHVYVLQALETLNDAITLGFDERLSEALAGLKSVWSAPG